MARAIPSVTPFGEGAASLGPGAEVWGLDAPVLAISVMTVAGGRTGSAASVASPLTGGLARRAASATPAVEPPKVLLHGDAHQILSGKNVKRSSSHRSYLAPVKGLCHHHGERTSRCFGAGACPEAPVAEEESPQAQSAPPAGETEMQM